MQTLMMTDTDIELTDSGDFSVSTIDGDMRLIGEEELASQEIYRIFREQFNVDMYIGGQNDEMIDIANEIENDIAVLLDINPNIDGEDLIVNVVPTLDTESFKIKIESIDTEEVIYSEEYTYEGGAFAGEGSKYIEEEDILSNETAPFFEIVTINEDNKNEIKLAAVPSGTVYIIDKNKVNFNGTFDINIPTTINTAVVTSAQEIIISDLFSRELELKEIISVLDEIGTEIEYELIDKDTIEIYNYEDYNEISITIEDYDVIGVIKEKGEIMKSNVIKDNLNLIYPFRKITNTKTCKTNIALSYGQYLLYYNRYL